MLASMRRTETVSARPQPPPLRRLQTAPLRDPHSWNVEVVRALSSRVPYGRTAVTTKCEACHSVFYPCLCSKAQAQQQTKAVRAPRIVEMAEKLRITPGTTGMGHLHYVKTTCFTHALDRHRLLVLGQGRQQDTDFTCTVVLRKGDAYVVHCDEGDDWSQELALTPSELRTVIADVRASYDPDEPTAPLSLQSGVAVARIETGFYEDEASALEDFGLMSVPCASTEGREQSPRSPGSLTLTAAAGSGQPDTEASYFVRWVKTGGPAYNAGVRPGQVLARMVCCKVVDRTRRLQEFFDPVEQLLLPFCRRPHADAPEELVSARAAQKAPGLEFPCSFEFDPLPSGWTVGGHQDEMGNDVEATLDSLQELCESLEDRTVAADGRRGSVAGVRAIVRFFRRPILVLSRSELSVRHQHRWEAAVTQQTSQINADDMEQLWEWGVRSRLSPSQLEFTFKKLITALTSELQAFEQERESRETTLVQNACKCAEIQMRGGTDEAVRVIEEELIALCAECPLYFLYEVRDGCNLSDEAAIRAVRRPRRSATKGGVQDELGHSGEGGALPVRVAAKTRARLLAYLPQAPPLKVVQSAGLHRLRERDAYEQANAVFQRKTLEALGKATNSYLAALERGQQGKVPQKEIVPGRIPVKWNQMQTQYRKVEKGRKDGRLSFDEFVKVLYNAGICWLSKVEMKNRFDSMDVDRSGFLSLGEVLCASERMKELVQQLREHERELDRCGQSKHSLQELLESFLSARGFSGQPGAKPPPGTPTCAPDWEDEKADSSAGSYEDIPGFVCHAPDSVAS